MTDTLHEALKEFRSDFEPSIKAMLTQLTRTSALIMNAYADIINAPFDTVEDIDVKKEDAAFLADLRHHHDMLLHSVSHEIDILQNIGSPRYVERYFNFKNDDLVEVDKQHYAGLPDEHENDTGGVVHSYNAPEL